MKLAVNVKYLKRHCSLQWSIAKILYAFSVALLVLMMSFPASAHHRRKDGVSMSGISIPNLTHGQLRIVSRYRSAILELADRQVQPDLEARTLQNFINLQFSYCLWGLAPGGISNEGSSFNECSHAYLAATKALLGRLRLTGETQADANILAQKIELAILEDAAASAICGNGIDPFNTAEIIMPEWRGITFNPLGILLGAFIMLPATGVLLSVRNRKRAAAHVA